VVARYEQTENIDEPLAMLRSAATSYYHADGLGSISSLSNSAGSIANTYTYDSFGKLTASTGSLVNPFRYTARESDTETGLYYYRARYYDQTPGRFISEDPIGFHGGGSNLYAYVGNSSSGLIDPFGLWPGSAIVNRIGNRIGQTIDLAKDTAEFWGQFGWGTFDMWNNYEMMQERNWKGSDLYYHCMANCQATTRGIGGGLAAKVISGVRTNIWGRLTEPDWRDDDKANKCGQLGADCPKRCARFIPISSPGKPPFPGW